MKSLKVAVAVALAAVSAPAQAFHDGGVARCSGCHTMHNSVTTATGTTNRSRRSMRFRSARSTRTSSRAVTPTDTCLNCHGATTSGSYHVLDTQRRHHPEREHHNFAPGGDFLS